MANSIDEMLMADRKRQGAGSDADQRRQEEMNNANQLRLAQMAARDGERQTGEQAGGQSGSFRDRWRAAKRAMNIKQRAKDKLEEKVAAPAKAGTSKALRWAWMTLIPSFGLSLIYINIHVFLKWVVGEKLFCKLGEEWIPKQIAGVGGEASKMAGSSIGLVEAMGLAMLDLLVLLVILGALGLIALIVSWATNPWEALKAIWSMSWGAIKSLVQLFSGLLTK